MSRDLKARFGSFGPHLYELANGRDPRPVVADWQRKSYGEESTFEHDLALDSLELRRVLIAHAEALGRRLRADRVRARTVTLKLKLARPLGGGRYPILTRSSLDRRSDRRQCRDREARDRADRARHRSREGAPRRNPGAQPGTRGSLRSWGCSIRPPAAPRKSARLNRALDAVAQRFGDDAVTRGLTHAERAAPSRRIK